MLRYIVSATARRSVGRLQVVRSIASSAYRAAVVGTAVATLIGTACSWTAQAAITIVDSAITPISNGANPTSFSIASFTVSSDADVLVVEVGTRGVNGSADTITFGSQTLTLATQFPSAQTVFRDSAIYYLYNPTPGTATLSGTFSPTGISDYVLSAFTLGGVNTAIAPITAGADGQTSASTTATLTAAQAANVVAGSIAILEQTLNTGTTPFTYSATAAGNASGTGAQLWTGTSGANILAAGGDVLNLTAGTDSYTGSAATNTNSKNPLVVAIFTPGGGTNWVGGTSTNWGVGSNWQGGVVPNSVTDGAIFGNAGANPSVTLSSGENVGSIVFNANVNTTVSGASTLTLGSSSSAATIAVNGGTHAINTPIALNNLTISTAVGSQLTLGGAIGPDSSNNSLTTTGGGTVVLGTANTFDGPTTITGGELRLGNPNSLQNSTVAVGSKNGLTFTPQIGAFSLGGLAGSGNLALADTAASPITLSIGSNGASTTYSGNLSGTGGLAKTGTGTLTLSGNGSYSGGTNILSGAVVAAAPGSLGAGPAMLSTGTTLRVNGNPVPLVAGFGGTSTDITGTGTGWTVNNTTIASNPIDNNVLTLTDNVGNEARSAFLQHSPADCRGQGRFRRIVHVSGKRQPSRRWNRVHVAKRFARAECALRNRRCSWVFQ